MIELIGNFLLLFGSIFVCIAALGVWRFKSLFFKLHAASKAATLGCGSLLLGAGILLKNIHGITEMILLIFFIALTNPISAHLIAKVAHKGRAK